MTGFFPLAQGQGAANPVFALTAGGYCGKITVMEQKIIDYERFSVLVIEDQPFVRRTIMQILMQIGFHRIAEADNGETGMQECIRTTPDLIVCDIDMKPVSGLQFLERLRGAGEAVDSRTPVVFLTNHTESDIVKKAMALGVNAFVVKPPSMTALKERVDRLLPALAP